MNSWCATSSIPVSAGERKGFKARLKSSEATKLTRAAKKKVCIARAIERTPERLNHCLLEERSLFRLPLLETKAFLVVWAQLSSIA